MKEENKKQIRKHIERRIRLNNTHIRSLRGRDKLYSIGDSEQVVLRTYVQPSGTKTFYYAYKPMNQKNWVRHRIGNFNIIYVIQARNKAKKYAAEILDGKDPVLIKRELKQEPTLIELIEDDFYLKRLLRSFGYKSSKIKTIKNYFHCWIKQKTVDAKIRQVHKEIWWLIQIKEKFPHDLYADLTKIIIIHNIKNFELQLIMCDI